MCLSLCLFSQNGRCLR
uniref:Uncharacterized protein n=1 Tax=Rhizophora mucronata TaxID=61149 RepID=A0A2P2N6B2_RHIMU